ncbi:M20 aminoacylase family protein [Pseudodonghicola flavimaris]|uniref:M20 aminoacylase family protein n=1 Tax=Pseudodonghicola flavimaris TaxID=3050036 RepID=A0ABT7EWN1_9RHOB|nr:M20 aminoacylase family protein [Pseudodonghicola flavimaris]MDK3016750.1 M20 aminoacylase family protein [Pseudodonghicola flavimaris]
MPVLDDIAAFAGELNDIRHDFHEHPELGFEEVRTSGIVAEKLRSWGIEVTTGIGKTGVVGVLKGERPGKTIGLRADMDALPIHEETNLPFSSKTPGVMHACGHDAHTTMLLGAAKYLSEHRDFAGTAVFIFQPAEEGLGGARAMLADGLFEKFPCDEIYGMHNAPHHDAGIVGVKKGKAMAGSDFFDITITGRGSHGARPEGSRDPIVIATTLVQQIQSIVSRNVPPTKPAVISVTKINAGAAYNVIPNSATLGGTIRFFHREVGELISERIRALCAGIAKGYEVEVDVQIRNVFDVLENDATLADAVVAAAAPVVGSDKAALSDELVMGSEDFADMLRVVPGAYCTVGHGGDVQLHNPGFFIDDAMLPVGANIYVNLVLDRGAAAKAAA